MDIVFIRCSRVGITVDEQRMLGDVSTIAPFDAPSFFGAPIISDIHSTDNNSTDNVGYDNCSRLASSIATCHPSFLLSDTTRSNCNDYNSTNYVVNFSMAPCSRLASSIITSPHGNTTRLICNDYINVIIQGEDGSNFLVVVKKSYSPNLLLNGAISIVFDVALVDVRFLHNGETFCRLSTIEQLGIGSDNIIQWVLRQVGGSNTDSERKEELEKSVELQLNNLENTYTNLKEMYMREADQLCEAKTEALNKMDCDDVLQDAEKEFKQRIDQCSEDAQEGIDAIRATLTHDPTRDKRKLAAIQVLEAGKVEEVGEIEVEKEEFISREKKRKVDSISHAFDAKINVKKQKIRKVQVGINTVQRLLPFDRGDAEEDVLNALKAHSMAAEAGKISTEDKSQDKVGTDTEIEDEDALDGGHEKEAASVQNGTQNTNSGDSEVLATQHTYPIPTPRVSATPNTKQQGRKPSPSGVDQFHQEREVDFHQTTSQNSQLSQLQSQQQSTDETPYPLFNIIYPTSNDRLLGRGGGTNNHQGNKQFRKIVQSKKEQYRASTTRSDKSLVAKEIVTNWRNQIPPGRFLKFDDSTKVWNDVGDEAAKEKTSQALREPDWTPVKRAKSTQATTEQHSQVHHHFYPYPQHPYYPQRPLPMGHLHQPPTLPLFSFQPPPPPPPPPPPKPSPNLSPVVHTSQVPRYTQTSLSLNLASMVKELPNGSQAAIAGKAATAADNDHDDDEEESQYELSQSLLSQPVGGKSPEESQADDEEEESQDSEDEDEEESQASQHADGEEESLEDIPIEQKGSKLDYTDFLIKKFNDGDLNMNESISMCQYLAFGLGKNTNQVSKEGKGRPGYDGRKMYPGSKTNNSGWMNAQDKGSYLFQSGNTSGTNSRLAAQLREEYDMYLYKLSTPQAPSTSRCSEKKKRGRRKKASRGKVIENELDETRTFVTYVDAEDKICFEERAQCDRPGQALINQIKKLDKDAYLATNTDDKDLAKSQLTPIANKMREISLKLQEVSPGGKWDLCSISGIAPYRYVPPRLGKDEFNMMAKPALGGERTKHVVPLDKRLAGEDVLTALYSRSTSLGLSFTTTKILWAEPSKTVQRILGYTSYEHNASANVNTRNVECVIVCDEGVVVTGCRNSKGEVIVRWWTAEGALSESELSVGTRPKMTINGKTFKIHKAVCFTFGSTKGLDKVESIDHTNRDGNDARDCNCRPANSFLQSDNQHR